MPYVSYLGPVLSKNKECHRLKKVYHYPITVTLLFLTKTCGFKSAWSGFHLVDFVVNMFFTYKCTSIV